LLILYLSGYWEFFGVAGKKLVVLSLEISLLIIIAKTISSPVESQAGGLFLLLLSLVEAFLVFALIKIIVVINKKEKINFEITFPLRHGRYLITDGGNSKMSRLMNYHFYSPLHKKNKTNYSMLFATDLVKIKKNKKGFIPRHNEEYPIFGEKVYCPMAGQVVKVENNIDDNEPFIGHYPYNTGNTVVIRDGNYYFLLGHLKKGSIGVALGETLKQNDLIGQIGNSGFSERPHLHMQLIESKSENYWKGKGICIRYKGQNLYKNRMIEID
jgi:hypothetical protein